VALTEDIAAAASYEPNLYLYDNYPGGIGQSAPLFRLTEKLFQGSLQLLTACPCETGCPSCVGAPGEVGERGKLVASRILETLTSPAEAANQAQSQEPATGQ